MSTENAAIQQSATPRTAPADGARTVPGRIPVNWPEELEFLACCARTDIDDDAERRIGELAKRVNWRGVAHLARHHRVMPLLYQTTKRYCPEHVPTEVDTLLRRMYLAAAALNLRLVGELHRVRRRLEDAGVKAIFFKGSVLAEFAYRNLGLRSCTDVDMLIRKSDFWVAERVLREDGYFPVKSLTNEGTVDPRLLRITGQCPFVRNDQPWSLDVHTALMPPGYSYSVRFDTHYARSVGVTLSEEEVRSFCAEDLLQILCFHGVKNRWEALKYVCDVAELIRSQPDLDWDEVLRKARSIRAERVLYVGLELARNLLDVALPEDVLSHMNRDSRVCELAGHVEEYLGRSHERSMGDKERFNFHLKIQDTLLNKARYGLFVIRRRLKDA